MNTFDVLTLKAFTRENESFFVGARIQKIQQPTRRDFVLSIRQKGESRKLYINIDPKIYHICFMSKENEARRRIAIPQKPPMFCMLLRKYLENSLIKRINQPENERIFEIYVETYNELGEKIYLCLAVELMGKHSNVILYNYDTNIILGCAHNVGAEKSRERELAGTLPYIYPPKQNKIDILNYNGNIEFEDLSKSFYLFSGNFAQLCKGKSLSQLQSFVKLENIQPSISIDNTQFSLYGELLEHPISQKSVNQMIDNYFSYYQEINKFNHLRTHLTTFANQNLKRTINSISKLEEQIQKDLNSDKYRLYGNLIMANLYSFKDYCSKIEVFDYENSQNIFIDLDPIKTLKENAADYYKLYNKSKTSRLKKAEMLEELLAVRSYYEHIIYALSSAKTYEDLLEIATEFDNDISTDRAATHYAYKPDKLEIDGYTVYVGKNNRQNDYIVSKLAKEDDLWFHTKNCAGSHVLLKCDNPSDAIIFECAKLAKQFSSASNSSKVGVIYTKRKHLKKPPKANLGYVTYKNEKEIVID